MANRYLLTYLLTYWLWALSKESVTFTEGYLVDSVIPEKKSKHGKLSRTGGHFWKNHGLCRLVTIPLKIVNSREKGFISKNSAKLSYTLSLAWKFQQDQKQRPMEITRFFPDQLITPKKSTSFLIDPWNFLMLFHFFNIPTTEICMSSTPYLHVLNSLSSLPHFPLLLNLACQI